MRRKPSIPTHSPHFSQESAKMTFFRHADVCNGGAVRAAPKCRKHPVFPAWSRGRQTNFEKKKKIWSHRPRSSLLNFHKNRPK